MTAAFQYLIVGSCSCYKQKVCIYPLYGDVKTDVLNLAKSTDAKNFKALLLVTRSDLQKWHKLPAWPSAKFLLHCTMRAERQSSFSAISWEKIRFPASVLCLISCRDFLPSPRLASWFVQTHIQDVGSQPGNVYLYSSVFHPVES